MLRRLFGFLLILLAIAAAGLVTYAYFGDMPAPTSAKETPAVGVGFDQ